MRFAILFSLLLVACGSAPEEHSTAESNNYQDNPVGFGGNAGEWYEPCGRTYVITITTDAGTFTKEIPVYCNPNGDEYHGDPPDYREQVVDPDPWEKPSIPLPEVNPQQNNR